MRGGALQAAQVRVDPRLGRGQAPLRRGGAPPQGPRGGCGTLRGCTHKTVPANGEQLCCWTGVAAGDWGRR